MTVLIAAATALNPLGLDVIGSAIRQSATDWLRVCWLWVTFAGVVIFTGAGCLEDWVRRRKSANLSARGRVGGN